MNRFRRYRDIVLVILLLAVPFFFLRASIRNPENLTAIDRALLRISAPVEYFVSALSRGISSLLSGYVYLVDVKQDNNKLAYENARLRAEVRRLSAAESESRRLRRLVGLRETAKAETVSAMVIAKDITEYFRVAHLVLDNAAPGIRPNMPVISLDGTVGTVQRVAGERVDVQLTVDSGFGVDVVVERTGARGFVRGVGDLSRYVVRVEYVQRTDEVQQGDILVTSGFGCRFPKGIPVAKVTEVVKRDFGIYQQVEAEPLVDFSRLDEVLIVLTDTKDCTPAPERRAKR
ncbi:MAG TPA: rod shape-determining protein MreC [Polyangiaceae bacterium]|nr:rod shape-determining protein MreC [Polyangiaceae bacterium]